MIKPEQSNVALSWPFQWLCLLYSFKHQIIRSSSLYRLELRLFLSGILLFFASATNSGPSASGSHRCSRSFSVISPILPTVCHHMVLQKVSEDVTVTSVVLRLDKERFFVFSAPSFPAASPIQAWGHGSQPPTSYRNLAVHSHSCRR